MDFTKYIGIPFKAHGEDFNGADCWGLVNLVLKTEFNIQHPNIGEYKDDKDIRNNEKLFLINIYKYWTKVVNPEIGDCILIQFSGVSSHVGIVVAKEMMLHTLRNKNAVIERFTTNLWQQRVKGFYRYGK